jgi:hypothetical protein
MECLTALPLLYRDMNQSPCFIFYPPNYMSQFTYLVYFIKDRLVAEGRRKIYMTTSDASNNNKKNKAF